MDSYCWNVTGQVGDFYTPCFNNTNILASLKHPMQRLANFIDSVNTSISRLVSLLILLMVVITFIIVVMRYVFGYGFVWMQELLLWFHGIVLMSGISYTMLNDQHVRVDVLYRNFNKKEKESIQISKGSGSVTNGFESITGQINTELKKPFSDFPFF